ncbi:hypothetical protein ACOMHN_007499 [Nucella lapillus]
MKCSSFSPHNLVLMQDLRCIKCSYTAPVFQLYDTVTQPPGRNPAVPNVVLEVALMIMGIGHSKARQLISATDLDPPSSSGMHVISRKPGTETPQSPVPITLGVQQTTETPLSPVPITLGQVTTETPLSPVPITQGVQQTTETPQSPVPITLGVQQTTDPTVTCPNHPGCTADTDRLQGFSEYQGGHNVASTVASAGVNILRCATDKDLRLVKGIADGETDVYVGSECAGSCTETVGEITWMKETPGQSDRRNRTTPTSLQKGEENKIGWSMTGYPLDAGWGVVVPSLSPIHPD